MATRRRRKKKSGDGEPEAPDETVKAGEEAEAATEDEGDGYPQLAIAWGNIVHDTFKLNPLELAKRLREELRLGDKRTEYAYVLEALDKSATNLFDAQRLYRSAVVEEQKFNAKCDERLEVLRTAATNELKAEKVKGSGAITKQQIEDRIMSNWPQEYTTILNRKAEMHGSVRALGTLVDAWASRCADLRIMAERAAKTRAPQGG